MAFGIADMADDWPDIQAWRGGSCRAGEIQKSLAYMFLTLNLKTMLPKKHPFDEALDFLAFCNRDVCFVNK